MYIFSTHYNFKYTRGIEKGCLLSYHKRCKKLFSSFAMSKMRNKMKLFRIFIFVWFVLHRRGKRRRRKKYMDVNEKWKEIPVIILMKFYKRVRSSNK